ncbi:hypothetical protein PV10_01943 [Exophiala mesophila]|uniref:Transcription factor domain-containing protein n=1 Tax=Exophiala mesophila TaxID=212818 RepID=A0A0D1YC48_EXOME|nr:uncharacterized protein PV10_01943 [Exophiala mesophila]KIV98276.1 hypothetical protein PV10_01943 [Exophiala mesophila]
MPKEERKTTFIVTTASAQGAWYPEKKAALSLINSHVANRKARLVNQRRGNSGASSSSTRPPSEASILQSLLDSTNDTLVTRHAEAPEASDTEQNLQVSWTFEELNDIFGAQEPSALPATDTRVITGESSSNRNSTSVSQPETTISEPRDDRWTVNRDAVLANNWRDRSSQPTRPEVNNQSVPELRFEGSGSRLPYRVARLIPEGKFSGNSSPSAPGIRPPSQLLYDSAIFAHIETLLDPRTQIAGEVTVYEQRLLHFFHTEGRQILFGTAAVPAYCPALHALSRGILQRSPAYLETHIAIAEHILCTQRSINLTANFFRRRADAYKTVADMILRDDADVDDQLCGLLCLQLAEHATGRPDLQAVHLKAMHQLVHRHGGMKTFFGPNTHTTSMIEPATYATHYTLAKFEALPGEDVFHEIESNFIRHLRQIRVWTLHVQGLEVEAPLIPAPTTQEFSENRSGVIEITAYLQSATDEYLRNSDAPYHQAAGIFYLLFSVCITFAATELDIASTTSFLKSLQVAMQESFRATDLQSDIARTERPKGGNGLHSYVLAGVIAQLRRRLASIAGHSGTWDGHEREVEISEACINTMKIFPSLSYGTRLKLSRGLLRSISVVGQRTLAEYFGDADLDDLHHELSRMPP